MKFLSVRPRLRRRVGRVLAPFLAAYAVAVLAPNATSQTYNACGPIENAYGPLDFWTEKKENITIVTKWHFTPQVENLVRGQTGHRPGGDIDYTLRAIPNHPNALISMMRLGEKEKAAKPAGARYTVECYFDRAMRFRPKDAMVRMIYGSYLFSRGKSKEAIEQIELAKEYGDDTPNLQYNLGLAFFEVGQFDRSLEAAHKAYAGGFALPGLKNKLVKAGKWRDPPAAPAQAPVSTEADVTPAGSAASRERAAGEK